MESITEKMSRSDVKSGLVLIFTGTVKNHDAHRSQRAAELLAKNHRIHGTHIPHQQSLLTVQLHRTHAGQTHTCARANASIRHLHSDLLEKL